MHSSRRQFLGITAALAVTSPSFGAEATLKAAVIGHTGRGDFGHGLETIFRDRQGIRLVAVADPDPKGRERVIQATGAPRGYADWRDLLAKEKPDLVSIAMRHADSHAEIALACLKSGAHLYLEKPFVRSPDEADAVLSAAQKHQRRVAVAHTMRMTPAVRSLKVAIENGRIGQLRELRAYGKQDARTGGEDMMVLGTHLVDLMRLMAGNPKWCSAQVTAGGLSITREHRRQVKDSVGWVAGDRVVAQFGLDHEVLATFVSDSSLRETIGHWGIEFLGSKGVARLICDLVPRVFIRTAGSWSPAGRIDEWKPLDGSESTPQGTVDHNAAPVSDWLRAIAENREPECSAQNGAAAIEMVSAVYHSSLSQKRVQFPLPMRSHPLSPTV